MNQPFLDLMNYTPKGPPPGGDYLDWLCSAPKTDGRFGFIPGSRLNGSGPGVFCSLTPYGMHVLEGHYITLIMDFGVFNYEILKSLCESPLPDAVVINLIDNAINYLINDEPGPLRYYTAWPVGYTHHEENGENGYWHTCGCNCFIDGKKYSLQVLQLLNTTGRVTRLKLSERFVPREECLKEFTYHPHPAAVDRHGNSLWEKGLNTTAVMIAVQRLMSKECWHDV